jgi:UDP-N-acetylmuramyl pentapeptide phosphotransferase/UDP-N-acetylglucosamine-1-phosphate transferase
MLDGVNLIIYGAVVSAISFFGVLFMTPAAIRSLTANLKVVPDAHKPEKPQVPRPAGPVIMISIAAAQSWQYFLQQRSHFS